MVSSSDGRAIGTWSSCLDSLRRLMLLDQQQHDGSIWKTSTAAASSAPSAANSTKNKTRPWKRSSSQEQQQKLPNSNPKHEFLKAISARERQDRDLVVTDPERLPRLDSAYLDFLKTFPRFVETIEVDQLRAREYAHLRCKVCLDYSGFGLFSHLQRVSDPPCSSFRLAYVSANLPTQALYGALPGGSLEGHVRRKIMNYFRLSDADYSMVFTASKSSAVRLLAESYRFDLHQSLLTAYDHHSQSIEWMIASARDKGARISSVNFRWQTMRICARELRKKLVSETKNRKPVSFKKQQQSFKGLFVFPLQSRVTGARYSYQWIPFAQEQQWQVLLDASALGPRDMDALGLSVFRPDFIVSSFYKVFGADPSGFGCLFIRKSAIASLSNSTRARSVGMVRLLPLSSPKQRDEGVGVVRDEEVGQEIVTGSDVEDPSKLSSFSGPLSGDIGPIPSTLGDDPGSIGRSADSDCDRDSEDGDEASAEKDMLYPSSSKVGDEACSMAMEGDENGNARSCSESSPEQRIRLRALKGKSKIEDEFDIAESSCRNEVDPSITSPPKPTLLKLLLDENTSLSQSPSPSPSPLPSPSPQQHPKRLIELLHLPELREQSPEEQQDDDDDDDDDDQLRIHCKALDQTRLLGMINAQNRLRCLISWLLLSLVKLRHPASPCSPLVQIYGPSGRKYNRGASMAFNLYDWDGMLFQPALVQRLADRNSISLGLAQLKNVKFADAVPDIQSISPRKSGVSSAAGGCPSSQEGCSEIRVVTIALSYVSSFEDVYRVWEFVAKFLDADFVNKEVWRYHTLNQQVVVLGASS